MNDNIGAVIVFRKPASEWVQEAILLSPEPDNEDCFGLRVTASQDVIIVGTPRASAPESYSGAAYVFRRHAESYEWVLETQLTASDGDFSDNFGFSVAVDGDVALIGARNDENDGALGSGSAYVFRFRGNKWVEDQKLTDPDGAQNDLFGHAVAVGMVAAATLSEKMTGFGGAAEQRDLIASLGLPVDAPTVSITRVEELMTVDKKRDDGGLRFVVLEAVGRPAVVHADPASVRAALAAVGIEEQKP